MNLTFHLEKRNFLHLLGLPRFKVTAADAGQPVFAAESDTVWGAWAQTVTGIHSRTGQKIQATCPWNDRGDQLAATPSSAEQKENEEGLVLL